MKKLLHAALAALLLAPALAPAQVSVAGRIDLSWTLPTTATDGTPLTGAQALTRIEVFISTAVIPNTASTPTLTLAATATTGTHTLSVPNNSTLHARIRACNVAGCSVLTAEVTKLVSVPVVPGIPTNVTITLTIVAP